MIPPGRQIITESAQKKKAPERKYVRYREGAELYGMSMTTFRKLAKAAEACSKYGNVVLVELKAINDFLDTCHID